MKTKQLSHQQTILLQKALFLQQDAQSNEASEIYIELLNDFPNDPEILGYFGTLKIQQCNYEQGALILSESLKADPKRPDILANLGFALMQLRKFKEALVCYTRALELDSDDPNINHNYSILLFKVARYDDALIYCDKAIALKPDYAEAHNNRGVILDRLERFEEALHSFDAAVQIFPDFAEAYFCCAITYFTLKKYNEAFSYLDHSIKLKPDYLEAYYVQGNFFSELCLWNKALDCYTQLTSLDPNCGPAYSGIAKVLTQLNRFEEAIIMSDKAINLLPDSAEAYNIRACVWHAMLWLEKALEDYNTAIKLKPDFTAALFNKAIIKLLLGEYSEGWALYECRKELDIKTHNRQFNQPLWTGREALENKVILLTSEQGYGDSIQFCRYVLLLESLGAKVFIEVKSGLAQLISTVSSSVVIIDDGNELPAFDFYCPLMSLPFCFGTTLDNIPVATQYLSANPDKRQKFNKTLGEKLKPRIGLVWSGGTSSVNIKRGIDLNLLAPLLNFPFDFHCLQKELLPSDIGLLEQFKYVKVHTSKIIDFSDTAALISEMDLIISVDTSVAHLACAMGKPVLILLPYVPDFRWGLNRMDCPWYPTARLFRQIIPGNWKTVIADLLQHLNIRL